MEKQEIVEFWEFWERREICEFGWRTGHALSLHFDTNLLVIDGMCIVLKKVYRLILSHVQMTGDVEPSSLLLKSARGSMPLQASVTV